MTIQQAIGLTMVAAPLLWYLWTARKCKDALGGFATGLGLGLWFIVAGLLIGTKP